MTALPILTDHEQAAITSDARQRVMELRAVARRLYPDRDDPVVLSELLCVMASLRAAENALAAAANA